ncbi:uncharacterized protein LOC135399721 [Ornithodoros turicata]|uniref:uncharacterized protein LOC135399721 n=1 Tax=Ornithodoros turicata TaxID=34597 RepID=UPI003138D6C1
MGIRGSLAPVVVSILTALKVLGEEGHRLTLQWVPGHIGIQGNEEANFAAAAAHRICRAVPIILPNGDRRFYLSALVSPLARQQWRHDITRWSLLHAADPSLPFKVPGGFPRSFTSLLRRLRLNGALTPVFRIKLGYSNTALCPACRTPATIPRIIEDCDRYTYERRVFRRQLELLDHGPFILSKKGVELRNSEFTPSASELRPHA